MKCPLLAIAWGGVVAKQQEEYPDCLKEWCAWWDEPIEMCLWLNVSEKLSLIYLELNAIARDMPTPPTRKK